MDMYLCRKVFASWLRKEGIQPEVVDLLQGRVSQSVLTRHYLVPQNSLKDQVLEALERLQQTIERGGEVWLTTTVVQGKRALRVNINSFLTEQQHVDHLITQIERAASTI